MLADGAKVLVDWRVVVRVDMLEDSEEEKVDAKAALN